MPDATTKLGLSTAIPANMWPRCNAISCITTAWPIRSATPEAGPGRHREHRLKNGSNGTGQHFRLRFFKRRDYGAHPRMGRGATALQHSREYYPASGSDDAAIPGVAGYISESRGETMCHPFQNSFGKTNDYR